MAGFLNELLKDPIYKYFWNAYKFKERSFKELKELHPDDLIFKRPAYFILLNNLKAPDIERKLNEILNIEAFLKFNYPYYPALRLIKDSMKNFNDFSEYLTISYKRLMTREVLPYDEKHALGLTGIIHSLIKLKSMHENNPKVNEYLKDWSNVLRPLNTDLSCYVIQPLYKHKTIKDVDEFKKKIFKIIKSEQPFGAAIKFFIYEKKDLIPVIKSLTNLLIDYKELLEINYINHLYINLIQLPDIEEMKLEDRRMKSLKSMQMALIGLEKEKKGTKGRPEKRRNSRKFLLGYYLLKIIAKAVRKHKPDEYKPAKKIMADFLNIDPESVKVVVSKTKRKVNENDIFLPL